MGTTIRREPVNFDIPNAPNYKFLNITNFRGLDVSSNPFELATNTASDCLNVYVDETNTLTTRPRLEMKIATPINGEHIGTYNLHNGYLLHYLVDDAGVMKTLIDGVLTDVTGKDLTPDVEDVANKQYYEIPSVKCEYFEQGDKIYLLDGERYMVIVDNVLGDVEGYVPTTLTSDVKGNTFDVESLNILSSKYLKKYNWDGVRSSHLPQKADMITNEAYINKHNLKTAISNSRGVTVLRVYPDKSAIVHDGTTGYYHYILDVTADILESQQIARQTTFNNMYIDHYATHSQAKKALVFADLNANLVHIYRFENAQWVHSQVAFTPRTDTNVWLGGNSVKTNDSCSVIWVGGGLFKLNSSTNTFDDMGSSAVHISFGKDNVAVLTSRSANGYSVIFTNDVTNTTNYVVLQESNTEYFRMGVSDDLQTIWFISNNNVWMYSGINYDKILETEKIISIPSQLIVQFEKSAIFDNTTNTLWFIEYTSRNLYACDVSTLTVYNTNMNVVMPEFVNIFAGRFMVDSVGNVWVWNSEEPFVTAEHTIIGNTDWEEKRKLFFKSHLNTRFDNNYWFASKNRYYRSQNNDPTYFPITEYNDLGDSNEEITGFNLANDTTLIAYKKNKVYLIQPFTSSLDTTEYTITESKNTVGNTAIGAPIVTTLTEIPLQINNDGIYGLSQLSNVSATERIADLMSEPINERWLNIDDSLIKNIKTLNRLYWTYVIIPNDKESNTQIYLLDNRTNSWYYWELPIVIMDAFAKDNITEFVDVRGDIYFLTTTDIIDKNYDDEKITKYYDEGERLIPWYWQSQVLYLGTMNYSKRLVNTTFILTDTDDSDGYGLQYNFKVFRKLASSTPEKEISDKLTLVRSTTKKTNISKFGFIQLRLSNLTKESRDYEAYENNKLRLVGLGLKYVLLEGLIR